MGAGAESTRRALPLRATDRDALAAYVPPVRHGGVLGLGWSPVPGRVDIVARYCDGVRTVYSDIPLTVARRYVRRFGGTHA